MEWLFRDWDAHHRIAMGVGLVAGLTLVVMGRPGIAELGAILTALALRWAIWQIPPPGRSKAPGTPADGGARLAQLAIAVVLVILGVDVLAQAVR